MVRNTEKKREYLRQWYAAHRAEIRGRDRQRYAANREAMLDRKRQRYAANRQAAGTAANRSPPQPTTAHPTTPGDLGSKKS